MTMANTSPVYARIDASLKDSAESILMKLGIAHRSDPDALQPDRSAQWHTV